MSGINGTACGYVHIYEIAVMYASLLSKSPCTSGLGTWEPPVRVFTHPEIVNITLVSGEGRE